MHTKFWIDHVVRYSRDGITYDFTITEIKIDHTGVYYSGQDQDGAVGWYKEKFLELVS